MSTIGIQAVRLPVLDRKQPTARDRQARRRPRQGDVRKTRCAESHRRVGYNGFASILDEVVAVNIRLGIASVKAVALFVAAPAGRDKREFLRDERDLGSVERGGSDLGGVERERLRLRGNSEKRQKKQQAQRRKDAKSVRNKRT